MPRNLRPNRFIRGVVEAMDRAAYDVVDGTVRLNREEFKLEGECPRCDAPLYCIDIDSGESLCSGDGCNVIVRFDAEAIRKLVDSHQ